jgi:SAM-dependent methyltransferase
MNNFYKKYRSIKDISYYKKNNLNKIIIKYIPTILIGFFFPVILRIKTRKKMVLDIGSGTGIYSYILRNKFKCTVDEIEPYLENAYNSKNVIRGKIEDVNITEKYDVILIIDILEHLNEFQLNKLFCIIRNNLREDGCAYIKVPNSSSISGLESTFGDLTHINFYNDIKVKTLIELNGFKYINSWGVGPNLRITRVISSILSLPFKILLYLYLYSHGCSGNYIAPSVIIKIKK